MSTYVLSKEKLREAGWEDLQKAVGHKYDSKYKKNGKWRYIYPNSGSRHGAHKTSKQRAEVKDEHLHAGASFAAGKEKGHYKIEKVEGGMVTFHHDDVDGKGTKGKTERMSVSEFKAELKNTRKEAVDAHIKEGLKKRKDILEKARKADPKGERGYVARAEKEVQRWEDAHGLKPDKADSSQEKETGGLHPAIEIIRNPPELVGSEKQKEWAKKIRTSLVEDVRDAMAIAKESKDEVAQSMAETHGGLNMFEAVLGFTMQEKSASRWIEGFHQDPRLSNARRTFVRNLNALDAAEKSIPKNNHEKAQKQNKIDQAMSQAAQSSVSLVQQLSAVTNHNVKNSPLVASYREARKETGLETSASMKNSRYAKMGAEEIQKEVDAMLKKRDYLGLEEPLAVVKEKVEEEKKVIERALGDFPSAGMSPKQEREKKYLEDINESFDDFLGKYYPQDGKVSHFNVHNVSEGFEAALGGLIDSHDEKELLSKYRK